MIYLISDSHFHHQKIIQYTNRNFQSVEEMNEHMIERWNKTVSNKDTIYHLGDFAFGNKEQISEIVDRLNGRKILIKGNHCKKSSKWYMECGFDVALDSGVILDEYYLLTHKPIHNIPYPFYSIAGHTHDKILNIDRHFNVSVELLKYKPILFNKIKGELNDKYGRDI
ncbi:phosphoesterase [Clostridiaceae bacterium HSG29]|nr:phosphoesterase [Clostridiaceae bacterium HSG29]